MAKGVDARTPCAEHQLDAAETWIYKLKKSALGEFPNLAAYVARGEARAAYQRAFAAQRAVNTGTPPPG